MRHRGAAALLASMLARGLAAGELRGSVSVESRAFAQRSAEPSQLRASASLALEPEYRWRWDQQRLVAAAFLRLEDGDSRRSHFDLRELYWMHTGSRWEWSLGLRRVHWGVAEAQHLVDVINQTDLVEDPDGEDKLGQPMASVALTGRRGRGELYLLPFFRERTFPGSNGRLRSRPSVSSGPALYDSPSGRHHLDWAARWSHHLGPCDLGLSYFSGTSREPSFIPAADGRALRPVYHFGRQAAVDAQVTTGPLLTKLEVLARWEGSRGFSAGTVGFEYTFAGVGGRGADVGALAEYLYDSRGAGARSPYQNDLFAGLRLALNDVQGTELLAGVVTDLGTGAAFLNLEASRRIGGRWRLATVIRGFGAIPDEDPWFALRRDSYAQLELRRHF